MAADPTPQDRLIFALDVPDLPTAVRYIQTLGDSVGCFKVGLELFTRAGPEAIRAVHDHSGAAVFLDLKLHDIPATVQRAVTAAGEHKVKFLTVHCSGGEPMLEAALKAVQPGLQLLGVTVLTSMTSHDLDPALGYSDGITVNELVMDRMLMSRDVGLTGFVCSAEEVKDIKKQSGGPILTVVPGIRPADKTVLQDDQGRVATPGRAIELGADYLVVGRPIRDAKDPKDAAQRIVNEIASALKA
ncbi:orotidine-5'-phosphate decarboxylase [Nitrospina gracilis]|uniref:orotidine-5'-phosphate decarboxylase n=1 Tax=Nitrospina sp. Nb-3 TaxID=2940485 RepID=UPI001F00CF34|nr:orotidine-5'-phosphate decarboxylase [Nitrospina sp. Nb-3]MCF8722904.1 orotidine-5'-phosphate decarboxylase [Nitrospina sp. Nb-3]